MTKAHKAGTLAIAVDGKKGSSATIAVAGFAMLITLSVGTARNSMARRDPGILSTDLKMSVRVYNYAGSSAGMLRVAEREAERIFARAGVHLEWHECLTTAHADPVDSTCAVPLTSSDLQLRIVNRMKVVRLYASAEGAGFAVGNLATVQLEPLLELQHQTPTECFLPLMLGRAIAHEFGHALLGTSHSSQGIMQALWDEERLGFAGCNAMVFTPDQTRALRSAVKTRNGFRE